MSKTYMAIEPVLVLDFGRGDIHVEPETLLKIKLKEKEEPIVVLYLYCDCEHDCLTVRDAYRENTNAIDIRMFEIEDIDFVIK